MPLLIQRLIDSVLVQHSAGCWARSVLALLAIFVVQAGFNFG